MFFRSIDMGIAARNEAELIGDTLTSLQKQELDGRYRFNVTVVASNCTDNTAEVAERTIRSFEPRKEISFAVIEESRPGKVAAINRFLASSSSEECMYGDGDMTVSEHCLTRTADTLHIPDVIVSGAISRQIISEKIARTSLGHMHRIRQLYLEASEHEPTPIGRMLAFKRTLLDSIPETAFAEDRFVTLSALKRFGERAVRCAEGAYVYGIATQSWEDYFSLGARYKALSSKLFRAHPELLATYEAAKARAASKLPPQHKVEQRLFAAMEAEGIPKDTYYAWLYLRRSVLSEPALNSAAVLREDGTWPPLTSTKSRAN